MSDTLQLVVELPNTQAHRTKSTGEEPGRCPIPTKLRVASQRQAEAYRTFVEHLES